jgi:hypothetical protein
MITPRIAHPKRSPTASDTSVVQLVNYVWVIPPRARYVKSDTCANAHGLSETI